MLNCPMLVVQCVPHTHENGVSQSDKLANQRMMRKICTHCNYVTVVCTVQEKRVTRYRIHIQYALQFTQAVCMLAVGSILN